MAGAHGHAAYKIMDGTFAGQEARTVVQQAIDWWRTYLDETEQSAAAALRLEDSSQPLSRSRTTHKEG